MKPRPRAYTASALNRGVGLSLLPFDSVCGEIIRSAPLTTNKLQTPSRYFPTADSRRDVGHLFFFFLFRLEVSLIFERGPLEARKGRGSLQGSAVLEHVSRSVAPLLVSCGTLPATAERLLR